MIALSPSDSIGLRAINLRDKVGIRRDKTLRSTPDCPATHGRWPIVEQFIRLPPKGSASSNQALRMSVRALDRARRENDQKVKRPPTVGARLLL